MTEPVFRLDPKACDQCGECVRACSAHAIELSGGFIAVDPERCDGCMECALACPTVAIAPLGRKAAKRVGGQALPSRPEVGPVWRVSDLVWGMVALLALQLTLRVTPGWGQDDPSAPWVIISATLAFYGLIVGIVWLIARRRGAAPHDLGLARFKVVRSLAMVLVLLAILLITREHYISIARMLGFTPPSVDQQLIRLFGEGPWGLVLATAVTVVVAPVVEETFFRGLVYAVLRERMRASYAICLSSLIFAIYHFSLWLVVPILLLGIALAWLTEWQRSIWPAVICHALNNLLAVLSVYVLTR